MPLVQVDEHGTSLSYIDSGPVEGDTYTTLVCVHGHGFHAQNFRKLLPIAPAHNMRVVALDRRDYQKSTLFTAEELDQLHNGDLETHEAFLHARGLEIARFLASFVETQKIPRTSADRTSGGLALLGWSAGNQTTLAFLRNVDSFPSELIQSLEPYLRTVFIYDVAFSSIGFTPPDGLHVPLTDPAIPERERGIIFGVWVSSYYKHPNPSLRTISGLQVDIPTSPYRPATNETMTYDDVIAVIDPAAGTRSELGYLTDSMREPLLNQMRGALFDTKRARIFPQVQVRMVYCAETPWAMYWSIFGMEKEIERWKAEGVQGRPLEIIEVDKANHFLHWDDPERALKVFAAGM